MKSLESLEQIARGETTCETCGSFVHVRGGTTRYYMPAFDASMILKMINELKAARAMRDDMKIVTSFAGTHKTDYVSFPQREVIDLYDSARKETDE